MRKTSPKTPEFVSALAFMQAMQADLPTQPGRKVGKAAPQATPQLFQPFYGLAPRLASRTAKPLNERTLISGEFGKLIRQHRRARKWTQEQLGIKARVSIRVIRDIEEGKGSVAFHTILLVLAVLEINLQMLLPGADRNL